MTSLDALPHELDEAAGSCCVVIETPRGSRDKFDFDPSLGAFILKKRLPEGMAFPLDFGFVPSTRAADGDPLDVMVLADDPLPMGLVVRVRLIGAIQAEQTKSGRRMRNDRLIGVAALSRLYADVMRLDGAFMEGLIAFWVGYNAREGEVFDVLEVADQAAVVQLVREASQT